MWTLLYIFATCPKFAPRKWTKELNVRPLSPAACHCSLAVSLPSYPDCRNVCSGLGGAGAVVLAAVVEGGRTLSKSEPNSQLFFQSRGFFVSTHAFRQLWWRYSLGSPERQSVPRNTASSQGLPSLIATFPKHQQDRVIEFLCHWGKGMLYNFTSSIRIFLSKSGEIKVFVTCSSAGRNCRGLGREER